MKIMNLTILIALMLIISGCSQQKFGFGFTPESNSFQQNSSTNADAIDILWVIDNSGSMQTSQTNVLENFQHFIQKFLDRGLNFQMGVITTDAYRDLINNDPSLSLLRDGNPTDGPSGYPIIDRRTPDVISVFQKNLAQGVRGNGDERAFYSIRRALSNPANGDFLRQGSFLAVIIVSDEDDFSHEGSHFLNDDYGHADLEPVSLTFDYLVERTNSTGPVLKFSVSAITIGDEDCLAKVKTGVQKIGERYIDLAEASNGLIGDICGDFAATLSELSGRILELLTQFPLTRKPDRETIRVYVDDKFVPEDPVNGWSYDPLQNSIIFHGTAVPPEGARITVDYTPIEVKK